MSGWWTCQHSSAEMYTNYWQNFFVRDNPYKEMYLFYNHQLHIYRMFFFSFHALPLSVSSLLRTESQLHGTPLSDSWQFLLRFRIGICERGYYFPTKNIWALRFCHSTRNSWCCLNAAGLHSRTAYVLFILKFWYRFFNAILI